MGIVACFASTSPDELDRLRANPDDIEAFLCPDDGESDPPNYIDLDKAWHGLHYLLNGDAGSGNGPLSQAIFGGTAFGPEIGYGPARFVTPAQVHAIAAAMAGVTVELLTARFHPADMKAKEIYPEVIWVRDGDQALEYVLEQFEPFRAFYAAAAARGEAVIQWQM